jgi:hypothetical protein
LIELPVLLNFVLIPTLGALAAYYRIRFNLLLSRLPPPAIIAPPRDHPSYIRTRADMPVTKGNVQVMGASASTSRTTAHIINDPDVWLLLQEGVFISPKATTRDDFCERTKMSQPRWKAAHDWLLKHEVIDRQNNRLIDKRLLKRGELVS